MSKYKTVDVWNRVFGARQEAYDYAGRLMKNQPAEIRTVHITRRLITSDRFQAEVAMFRKIS